MKILCSRIQVCAVLVLMLISSAHAKPSSKGFEVDAVPGWVIEREYDAFESQLDQSAVQYLLLDQQRRFMVDAKKNPPEYFFRFALRLNNSAGLSQNSQLEISFNPLYQTLHLHSLKVIRDGVTRELVDTVYVRLLHQEKQLAADIHEGRVTAVLIPEDLRVGDILEYSYTLVGRNPIFGSRHFGNTQLEWGVPVQKLALRILTDSDDMVFRAFGMDAKPKKSRFQGLNEYSLVRNHVDKVVSDGETSPEYTPFAWLDFSEYTSWQDVNRWAKQLYAVEDDRDEEIRLLAGKLKRQSIDDADYITRALFFVQNEIRYLGLELGENSHRPHPPAEVLKKRYGDCKDKSLLLSTLLQMNGIRAWPALVSSTLRYGVEQGLPSPGVFDHAIVLVEFKGKRYWLDGTRQYQAGGLDDLGYSDFGYALVVGHRKAGLQRMYPRPPVASRIDVEEEIVSSDFNTPVILKVTTTYHRNAAEAQRYQFENNSLDSIKRQYLEYYSRYYSGVSVLADPVYEDDVRHNQFVVNERYQIDGYWKHKESTVSSTVYNLSYLGVLKAPNMRQRTTPYLLGQPRVINSSLRIHYPKPVVLKLDEKPVQIEHPAVRYTYRDKYSDGIYTHTSSLETKQKDVALSDLGDYLNSLEEIRRDWEYTLTVVNPDKVSGYQDFIGLKDRLRNLSGASND
ncbi:MAG: DUF3857 domain-containing transglutaminase family protein [Candidatus Promineifilaceae bacterium]